MRQTDLGQCLGLTFQQVQKYEKGTNRISASKLWALSHLFKVPIEWFFHGFGEVGNGHEDVVTKPDALQLAKYFSACPPPPSKRLRFLVRATADMSHDKRKG